MIVSLRLPLETLGYAFWTVRDKEREETKADLFVGR